MLKLTAATVALVLAAGSDYSYTLALVLPVLFLFVYALGWGLGYWTGQSRCLDASRVRAEALEDAAEDLFYSGDADQPLPGYTALLERAESERSAS